jgi:hypothetical protein
LGYIALLGAIYESAMLDYVDEILNKKAGVETHKQNFLPGGKFIQKNPYGISDGTTRYILEKTESLVSDIEKCINEWDRKDDLVIDCDDLYAKVSMRVMKYKGMKFEYKTHENIIVVEANKCKKK